MTSDNDELSPGTVPVADRPVSQEANDLTQQKQTGKKKKQVKSKAMILDSDDQAVSDAQNDIEMADGTQMGVNTLAISAQRAIFSLNRINLRVPPVDLKFGEWNDRPLRMARAKELLASMKSQELRPFLLQNMMPIIIPRSDIDPSCLSLDFQNVSTSPMIKLTASGAAKGALRVAGGQHRYHAVKIEVDETMTLIQKTRDQLEKEKERVPKTDQAQMMISRGNELAMYISRNEQIKHFPEDEREGLVMYVKIFRSKLRADAGKTELSTWLRKLAHDAKQSALGQIMNHTETQEYLMTLDDFEPHFNHHKVYSTTWVKSHLHSVSGGVITTITEYLANIWRSLISPMSYFSMEDEGKWRAYQAEIKVDAETRDVELMREGAIAWGSLTDSSGLQNRAPLFSLLTTTFMTAMNDATSGQSGVDFLLGSSENEWELYCQTVESLFDQHILTKVFEGQDERKVQSTFRRKWDYMKFHHDSNHFQRPLPLMTPMILEGLGEVMSRITNAHTEFWRWIDPIGQYFCFNLKNPNEAKDISAWGLRTIRANAEDSFANPENTARDVAHFVLKYADAFFQFESDIASFKIPSRPLFHSEQSTASLEKKYPDLKVWVQDIVKTMRANKAPGQLTGNWILDRRSHYDWHLAMFKNAGRDYIRFAQIAYVEDHITSKYRKKMLQKFDSAAFIRQELHALLSSHAKSRRILAPASSKSSKIVKEYAFPDGISLSKKKIDKIEVDITDLVTTQDSDKVLKKHRQALSSLVKRVEKAPFAVARPDTTLISPKVSVHLEALKEALLQNIYVLNSMRRASDIAMVDPLDEKWDDMDDEIVDLDDEPKPVWTTKCNEAKTLLKKKSKAIENQKVHASNVHQGQIRKPKSLAKGKGKGREDDIEPESEESDKDPILSSPSPSPANDADKNDEMTMSQEDPIVNADVPMPPQMQSNEAVRALMPTQVCPPPLVPTQLNDRLEDVAMDTDTIRSHSPPPPSNFAEPSSSLPSTKRDAPHGGRSPEQDRLTKQRLRNVPSRTKGQGQSKIRDANDDEEKETRGGRHFNVKRS